VLDLEALVPGDPVEGLDVEAVGNPFLVHIGEGREVGIDAVDVDLLRRARRRGQEYTQNRNGSQLPCLSHRFLLVVM
jgi:hypothetical protein